MGKLLGQGAIVSCVLPFRSLEPSAQARAVCTRTRCETSDARAPRAAPRSRRTAAWTRTRALCTQLLPPQQQHPLPTLCLARVRLLSLEASGATGSSHASAAAAAAELAPPAASL
eukprot:760071-Prymnesium_polylepis.1